jgi:hypothetical protein
MVLVEAWKKNKPAGSKFLWNRHIMAMIYITMILIQKPTIACARERHFNSLSNETMSVMNKPVSVHEGNKFNRATPSKVDRPSSFNSASLTISKHKGSKESKQEHGKSPSRSKQKEKKASLSKKGSPSGAKKKGEKSSNGKKGKTPKFKKVKSKSIRCTNPIMTHINHYLAEMPKCPNTDKNVENAIVKYLTKDIS